METSEGKLDLLHLRIETPNLAIVPIALEFKDEIFKEFTEDIATYMFPQPSPDITATIEFIKTSIEGMSSGKEFGAVILKKDTNEFIGCGGLHDTDTTTPELGIWIKKSAHGHKYGREAMVAIKDWADKNISYEYIRYPVHPENIPSRKIPEAMGAKVHTKYKKANARGKEYEMLEYRILKARKSEKSDQKTL